MDFIVSIARRGTGTKQGQQRLCKTIPARKRLLLNHLRAVFQRRRRAGDSNPPPLAGLLISSRHNVLGYSSLAPSIAGFSVASELRLKGKTSHDARVR